MPYLKDGKRYCDWCHSPQHLYICGAEERAIKRFRQWELPPDMNVDTNPTRWQVFKHTVRVRLLDWYWRRK